MKVKLACSSEATMSDRNLVDAAQEVCDAYLAYLEVDSQSTELDTLISNITFARDTIRDRGAKWYIDNCDPEEMLKAYLEVDRITLRAAEEGLGSAIKEAWDKLIEVLKKFINWIASFFMSSKKSVSDQVEATKTQINKASENIKKATEKFEEAKKNPEKMQEIKAAPETPPSVPEPPEERAPAFKASSGHILLTYNADPKNKVFIAGDFKQWESLVTRVATLHEKVRGVILEAIKTAPKTAEEAEQKDKITITKCRNIVKQCGFEDSLTVGDGSSGILAGIIAINESAKLYPQPKSGTYVTLNCKTLEENQTLIRDMQKVKQSSENLSISMKEAENVVRAEVRTLEKETDPNADDLKRARSMKFVAITYTRMATSIESIVKNVLRNLAYDSKIVAAAMNW